jgi:hypothetical protein
MHREDHHQKIATKNSAANTKLQALFGFLEEHEMSALTTLKITAYRTAIVIASLLAYATDIDTAATEHRTMVKAGLNAFVGLLQTGAGALPAGASIASAAVGGVGNLAIASIDDRLQSKAHVKVDANEVAGVFNTQILGGARQGIIRGYEKPTHAECEEFIKTTSEWVHELARVDGIVTVLA